MKTKLEAKLGFITEKWKEIMSRNRKRYATFCIQMITRSVQLTENRLRKLLSDGSWNKESF